MKTLIATGWMALFGGLLFSTNQQEEKTLLPLINSANVNLIASKGVWLAEGKPFTGMLYELSPEGDTLSLSGFDEGREHGRWKTFYRRAKPKAVRQYEHGKKIGVVKSWYENGQPMSEASFKNDEYDGLMREWAENGQPLREANYNMGYEEGPQRAWYPNGKVRSNYVMVSGRRYGLLGTKNCANVSDRLLFLR